jgi:hypothetical protein
LLANIKKDEVAPRLGRWQRGLSMLLLAAAQFHEQTEQPEDAAIEC